MNRSNSSTLTDQVKSAFNKTKNIGDKIMNSTSKMKNTISTGVSDKINKVSNSTSKSQMFQSASSFINTFVETNTAFSKFVYIILVLLLFVFLFQIGMALLSRFINGYSGEVYIINGLHNSKSEKIVSANPSLEESVSIIKSVNEDNGIEFTWSVWFYINKLDTSTGSNYNYNRIFSKGIGIKDDTYIKSDIKGSQNSHKPYTKILNTSPGIYITKYIPTTDTTIAPGINGINFTIDTSGVCLVTAINTFNPSIDNSEFSELITIDDIPIQKWVNCTLIIQNRNATVYINNQLIKQKILNNVPVQNYYDTYVGDNNGFDGYISNLKYYNRAISYEEVRALYAKGPNLKSVDSITPNGVDYLSLSWYYNI